MIIALNDLTEDKRDLDFSKFPEVVRGYLIDHLNINWKSERIQYLKSPDFEGADGFEKGFVGFVAGAYSRHSKITINPHDVWYVVLSEIAAFIEKNAEACRPMFTREPGKIEISVQTDDVTKIDLAKVEYHLRQHVPVDLDIFLPEFTTSTPRSRYASLAAFCAGMSAYYDYSTFMCGIPAIKIGGTMQDWEKVEDHLSAVVREFSDLNISPIVDWLTRLRSIILLFVNTKFCEQIGRDPPVDEWKNIFSKRNVGSGRQFTVSGWITDLYLNNQPGDRFETFPFSWNFVPYRNTETGRSFHGVHGAFTRRRDADDFLSLDYDEMIIERVAKSQEEIDQPFKIEVLTVMGASKMGGR